MPSPIFNLFWKDGGNKTHNLNMDATYLVIYAKKDWEGACRFMDKLSGYAGVLILSREKSSLSSSSRSTMDDFGVPSFSAGSSHLYKEVEGVDGGILYQGDMVMEFALRNLVKPDFLFSPLVGVCPDLVEANHISWFLDPTPFFILQEGQKNKALSFIKSLVLSSCGYLSSNPGFFFEDNVSRVAIVYSPGQEKSFSEMREASKSLPPASQTLQMAFHGTSNVHLASILGEGAQMKKQTRMFHGPCAISLTQIWDNAAMFAHQAVKAPGESAVVVVFKLIMGDHETRESHEATDVPMPGDTRIVLTDKIPHRPVPSSTTGGEVAKFQILPRLGRSIAPIGYIQYTPFNP